jgi:hypothetical protein
VPEYRVTALRYRFKSDNEHDRFDEAVAQEGSLGNWGYRLEAGLLTAVPSAEFHDRQAARDDLERHLRAWEQTAFLSTSSYRIHFEYDRADMVDADPSRGSSMSSPTR